MPRPAMGTSLAAEMKQYCGRRPAGKGRPAENLPAIQRGQEPFVGLAQPAITASALDEFGPAGGCQAQRLLAPPARDVGVVPTEQFGGHRLAVVDFGAGVVRTVEQARQVV